MDKQTLSFRLDSDKAGALDALAEALDRDRSYLLNEAVTAYIGPARHLSSQKKVLPERESSRH